MFIELVPTCLISATEEIDTRHQQRLSEIIEASGCWINPIVIHDRYMFVMDGHHRLATAHELGLTAIPVVKLNYQQVKVDSWRKGWVIDEEIILTMYIRTRPSC